jgi:CRP-like cAMP-binding protein
MRRRQHWRRDSVITSSAEPPDDTIFVILQGSVRVSILAPDGKERALVHLPAGSIFGEQASLGRTALAAEVAVLAETDCLIGEVATSDILTALRTKPDLFVQIMRIAAEKTSILFKELERSTFGTAKAQIAALLLSLPQSDGCVAVSQERLAQLIGKTRVTVGEQLHRLQTAGAIVLERSRIRITDAALLLSVSRNWDGD